MNTLSPAETTLLVVADDEPQAAFEHVRDLLVDVMVARHDGAGRQQDAADRHRLGVEELPSEQRCQRLHGLVVPAPHLHGPSVEARASRQQ